MIAYWEKMKLAPSDTTKVGKEKRKGAYEKAHEIRKFEIGLFWQRATYYWAFILAAFTAHFALLGLLFSSDKRKDFSIPELYNLSGLSLFALVITAFFCFFFSLCWVLMNKGSKFWQKNWEGHIDELEPEFSGELYKVILNTKNKEEFNCCPLSLSAYDYSVSKVTSLTSVVLMVASFFLFAFYVVIFGFRFFRIDIDFKNCACFRWIVCTVVLIATICFSVFICCVTKGNAPKRNFCSILKKFRHVKDKPNVDYWINRDELKE